MAAPDPLVCQCVAIYRSEIVAAIEAGAGSLAEITEACDAGSGCRSCHVELRELLAEHTRSELARERSPGALRQLGLFEALTGVAGGSSSGGPQGPAPAGAHRRRDPERG